MASLQTLLPVALWLSLAAVSSAKCAFTQPCYTGKLDDPTCVPVATNSSNDQPKPVRYPFLPPTVDHVTPPLSAVTVSSYSLYRSLVTLPCLALNMKPVLAATMTKPPHCLLISFY